MVALPAKAGISTREKTHVKRPHTQFTCVTCSLPVKTSTLTCFYAASTSRRVHAIAGNRARKLRVVPSAGCRLTYLQFLGEFTQTVIVDCQQLQGILCATASILACDCACFFACVSSYFWLRLVGIFTYKSSVFHANWMFFACKSGHVGMLVDGKFAWVPLELQLFQKNL